MCVFTLLPTSLSHDTSFAVTPLNVEMYISLHISKHREICRYVMCYSFVQAWSATMDVLDLEGGLNAVASAG